VVRVGSRTQVRFQSLIARVTAGGEMSCVPLSEATGVHDRAKMLIRLRSHCS
jgi:hypothetical protein